MTVPIATSPKRAGFGPELSLSYDSGSWNGPFGFGWSRQFDFNIIADVILQVRDTSRKGGNALRSGAVSNLNDTIANAKTPGSVRSVFSMRQEFPADWAKFKSVTIGGTVNTAPLSITVKPEHYPFWSHGSLDDVLGVILLAASTKDLQVSDTADGTGNSDALVKNDVLGGLRSGPLKNIGLPSPTGTWTFYFNDNSMKDLWLAVSWGKES